MEFTPGDAHREGEAFFPREGGTPTPPRVGGAGSDSSPSGAGLGASDGDSGKAGSTDADAKGTTPDGAVWGLCSEEELQAAAQRAARARLEARACPLDLSEYRSSADAGVLAGPAGGEDAAPLGAGQDAAARLSDEVKEAISTAGDASHQLSGDQLDLAMTDLLEIGERTERAQVFILADAVARGVVDESDSGSPVQWLTDKAPCLEPGQASRIAQVARIITESENACLRSVLAEGRVTVHGVLASVREARRVRLVLPDASWEQLLGYYLALADRCPTSVLRNLSKEIVAAYGKDKAPADEDAARKHESLSWYELPGGLTRVRADLSPGDAAVFANAIEALAKPRPGTTSDGDTAPAGAKTMDGKAARTHGVDQRSPGKRRADALMELINAAQRATEHDGGRASVRATITIPLSVLIGSLVNAGHAVTALGQIIDAGTARTMACSAQLTPMVLGTQSQPVDVGRDTRHFKSATRAAIVKRDRGCTFPGCDRPAPWCEAHHAVPWWVNGRSNQANGTLLCSRHHHIVHSKGYLPWISETEVIWDLDPGQMPTNPLPPDDPLTYGPGAPPDYAKTA